MDDQHNRLSKTVQQELTGKIIELCHFYESTTRRGIHPSEFEQYIYQIINKSIVAELYAVQDVQGLYKKAMYTEDRIDTLTDELKKLKEATNE